MALTARNRIVLYAVLAIVVGCVPRATTPDVPTDTTADERGFVDGGGFFSSGDAGDALPPLVPEVEDEQETESFFLARSIDPATEDSAGAKFLDWGDFDGDGLPDLASAWNQSQVIQIHLQRRDTDGTVRFESVQVSGTSPIAIVAGLELADMDLDGNLDIVLAIKHRGAVPFCSGNGLPNENGFTGEVQILFNPGPPNLIRGAAWPAVEILASDEPNLRDPCRITATTSECNTTLGQACVVFPHTSPLGLCVCDNDFECDFGQVCDRGVCSFSPARHPVGSQSEGTERAIDTPENGGITALGVGDMNGDGFPDIVITSNRPDPPCENSDNDLELYLNPGPGSITNPLAWADNRNYTDWRGTSEIVLERNIPPLKHLLLDDVDLDGDLDIIYTRPTASSANISWRANPLVEAGAGAVSAPGMWTRFPVGQVDGGADVMTLGDVDRDGFNDIVVRSNQGQVVEWFRRPGPADQLNNDELPGQNPADVRTNVPWSVFVLIEVPDRVPLGIELGDINFDGQPEVLVGAEGSVLWLDSSTAESVFDSWTANLIADEGQLDDSLFAAAGPAFINDILVLDIDCDGANDVLATIDRRELSGLGSDAIVWFRNVLTPEDVGLDIELVPGCP